MKFTLFLINLLFASMLTVLLYAQDIEQQYAEIRIQNIHREATIQELQGRYLRDKYDKMNRPPQAFYEGEARLSPPLLLSDMIQTQGYGITPHIKAYGGMGLGGHPGIDWLADEGDRVYAAHDGVVFATRSSHKNSVHGKVGYGNNIKLRIRDGDAGYETVYAHLSRVDVKEGQVVRSGDVIGLVGDTGFSSAPHLHFGLRFLWFCDDGDQTTHPCEVMNGGNGMMGWINPLKYLHSL